MRRPDAPPPLPPAFPGRDACLPLLLVAAVAAVAAGCTGNLRPVHPDRAGSAASVSSVGPSGQAVGPASGDRVMVTLHPGPPRRWQRTVAELRDNFGLRAVGLWPIEALDVPCVLFELPSERDPERLIARLGRDPRVESAQPVFTFRTLAERTPRDASAETPWDDPYAHLQRAAAELRLGAAHRLATGRGVRVAVVDTGLDFRHPDLAGRIAGARDFVQDGESAFTGDVHGTAVAGVIAAAANNGLGIVGVAPGAEVLAVKACWQEADGRSQAACDSYTLAQGLDFAISNGSGVINLSLTGPEDPLLRRLVLTAIERGIPVVAAAERPEAPGFPASVDGVLAVSPSDGGGVPPDRSSGAGAQTPLAAPGVDVLTTLPGDGYDFLSGSSLAAAHVAGVAALLLERAPDASRPAPRTPTDCSWSTPAPPSPSSPARARRGRAPPAGPAADPREGSPDRTGFAIRRRPCYTLVD